MVAGRLRRLTRTSAVIIQPAGIRLRISHFLRDIRGGATSIVAAWVTVMVVVAAALIVDHNWLVDKRDVLKAAADAGAIAATKEMRRPGVLGKFPDDDEGNDKLKEHLEDVAETYVLLNLTHLSEEDFKKAERSLDVDAEKVERDATSVDLTVKADLGGTLFSRHIPILNSQGPEKIPEFSTKAGVEGVSNPIEVVLAIDVSGSMSRRLDGGKAKQDGSDSRMAIVKRAASTLVDIVSPDSGKRIAVGLVPWQAQVRLNEQARANWEREDWAKYPDERIYGAPYRCTTLIPCDADKQDLPDTAPEPWRGCLDEQRVDGGNVAKLPDEKELLSLPSQRAFAQGIYAAYFGVAYDCLEKDPGNHGGQQCYGTDSANALLRVYDNIPAQKFCTPDMPAILPLSSDTTQLKNEIAKLEPIFVGMTYSALGVLWGQRLLSHEWQDVWGHTVHPVDPESDDGAGVRKAIVLLTDGEDNQCGFEDRECKDIKEGIPKETACELAKVDGTEIFVVAAMDPMNVSGELADSLRACSSEDRNPTGTYVFINNENKEDLEKAFADIANQLTVFRRVK